MINTIKLHTVKNSKFHMGDEKGKLKELFSSDQLISALINNVRLLYDDQRVEDFILKLTEGNLVFSSVFYGIDIFSNKGKENVKTLYFLPKPTGEFSYTDNKDSIARIKDAKKIKYLSIAALQEVLNSWDSSNNCFYYNLLDLAPLGKKFGCLDKELEDLDINSDIIGHANFFKVNTRPGVQIKRLSNSSEEFYYQNELEILHKKLDDYTLKPFMFFLCQGDLNKECLAAFRLLGDEGIGGKRSKGMGIFEKVEEVEGFEQDFPFDLVQGEDGKDFLYMALSSYFPKPSETASMLNYELEKRSGYIYKVGATPYRKKSVRIVKEGALFSSKVEGEILNISPQAYENQPVYLSAKPLLLRFGGSTK